MEEKGKVACLSLGGLGLRRNLTFAPQRPCCCCNVFITGRLHTSEPGRTERALQLVGRSGGKMECKCSLNNVPGFPREPRGRRSGVKFTTLLRCGRLTSTRKESGSEEGEQRGAEEQRK
ncbi:unnamed protein product [Pleuronectes platessa]|uniref:Uncharacterized protein n=1 Tax=Pleuronectes platessa TaxID=8262 RepID=A0A9N7VHF3_PLEPL|nr:unnamed protein product [Pleuronectes platessa]